jgi:hypothetical protein
LARLSGLEEITVRSKSEVLNLFWSPEYIVSHNLATTGLPTAGVTRLEGIAGASPQDIARSRVQWKEAHDNANDVKAPDFYENLDRLRAFESRMRVNLLRRMGVNLVVNLVETRGGGHFNNVFVNLSGIAPANRLARVLYDRTGLVVQIDNRPRLQVDEESGYIHFPASHLLSEDLIRTDLDLIFAFINANRSENRITLASSLGVWVNPDSNRVKLRSLAGQKVEVSFGQDGTIGAIDLRPQKVSFATTVPQRIDSLESYVQGFGTLAPTVSREIQKNSNFTQEKSAKSDHRVSMIIVDHVHHTVESIILNSDNLDLKPARERILRIASSAQGHEKFGPPLVTILFQQSSSNPSAVDPKSLRFAREAMAHWRLYGNLSQLWPPRVNIQLVNSWNDPDDVKPLIFHRPLFIYSTDNNAVTRLSPPESP